MSTRAVIARPWGDGFEGRYHHFDGYPQGLGSELWSLHSSRYSGDVDAMVSELIDAHPAGWSTLIGADWSLEVGFEDSLNGPCMICGLPSGDGHYRQYLDRSDPRFETPPGGAALYADHHPERPLSRRPQCYCHGARSESEQWVRSSEDDCGTEWAYVLSPGGLLVCQRRWREDGAPMIGMFGMGGGVDGATWLPIGLYAWSGAEPDWDAVAGFSLTNA